MSIVSDARRMRPIIEQAVQSLSANDALAVVGLHPAWVVGTAYEVGARVKHGGVLYEVMQAHTAQADWTPDTAVSLFQVVNETHSGTADDPIPYDGNMVLENGKYYTEDGVIYLCNRDTGTAVYNSLADLVGLYVEAVE